MRKDAYGSIIGLVALAVASRKISLAVSLFENLSVKLVNSY